jgi:hypothetical protein
MRTVERHVARLAAEAPNRLKTSKKSAPTYRSIEMSRLSSCIITEPSTDLRRACMPIESVKGGAGGNLGG